MDFFEYPKYLCVAGNLEIIAHLYYQLLYLSTETDNKCLWLQMARMEMDYNLKNLGLTFQVVPARLKTKNRY